MKGLEQRPIISSGLKGRRSQYNLEMPPPEVRVSFKQDVTKGSSASVILLYPHACMTYEMQAPGTVTPYRGNLCTTAATEDQSVR